MGYAFAATLENVPNGTRLDDNPIAGKVKLHDGDRIQVGPILIAYHVSSSGMSTETVNVHKPKQKRNPETPRRAPQYCPR